MTVYIHSIEKIRLKVWKACRWEYVRYYACLTSLWVLVCRVSTVALGKILSLKIIIIDCRRKELLLRRQACFMVGGEAERGRGERTYAHSPARSPSWCAWLTSPSPLSCWGATEESKVPIEEKISFIFLSKFESICGGRVCDHHFQLSRLSLGCSLGEIL